MASRPRSAYASRQSGLAALAIALPRSNFFASGGGGGTRFRTPGEPWPSLAISRARRRVASRSIRGSLPGAAAGGAASSRGRKTSASTPGAPSRCRGAASPDGRPGGGCRFPRRGSCRDGAPGVVARSPASGGLGRVAARQSPDGRGRSALGDGCGASGRGRGIECCRCGEGDFLRRLRGAWQARAGWGRARGVRAAAARRRGLPAAAARGAWRARAGRGRARGARSAAARRRGLPAAVARGAWPARAGRGRARGARSAAARRRGLPAVAARGAASSRRVRSGRGARSAPARRTEPRGMAARPVRA